MKRFLDTRNDFGTLWSARTPNFTVSWFAERSYEKYDGDDEDGSIQAALDDGEMVMFDSVVTVECNVDGVNQITIGRDYLGSSVYKSGEVAQFMGDGYFRDMLATACTEARAFLAAAPKLRSVAA